MTKAIQHLIHLDFEGAYTYNKLSFVVAPILIFLWIYEVKNIFLKIKKLYHPRENKNLDTKAI